MHNADAPLGVGRRAGKRALGIHGMWCSFVQQFRQDEGEGERGARVLLLRGRYFRIIESAAPTEIVFMDPSPLPLLGAA